LAPLRCLCCRVLEDASAAGSDAVETVAGLDAVASSICASVTKLPTAALIGSIVLR
jgi:hypothetical protein